MTRFTRHTSRMTCGALLGVALLLTIGCSSGQKTSAQTAADYDALVAKTDATVSRFKNKAKLQPYFDDAAGWAVFARVAKGAFIVGGGHGDGVLYEGGSPTGQTTISQGSIGLQIGGQTFDEIVFLEDKLAVDRFKQGNFELDATASAVIAGEGASSRAAYEGGIAVFIADEKGAMAEASVGGQKFTYKKMP